jgi:hypothetical protein
MPRYSPSCCSLPALLAAALLPLAASGAPAPPTETPAEKAHKALRKPVDLEIHGSSLQEAVNQLRQQTGLNFVLDPSANPNPLGPLVPTLNPTPVSGQFHHVPLGKAVRELFRPHSLTCAAAGDTLWIGSPQVCLERQMEQVVSVDAKDLPLEALVGRLARDSGVNILLDRRVGKERQEKLTLHLEDVALLTAVELVAGEAGLQMVRLDSVLYVTIEQRAQALRRNHKANRVSESSQPPVGAPSAPGTVPQGAGMLGVQGAGALGALGGGLGALGNLGVGGGGFVGNIPAGKMPLTPPLPPKKVEPNKEEPKKQPEVKPGRAKPEPPRGTTRKPASEAALPSRPALTARQRRWVK